jgi:16S rRNA (cytidine1402-2'-O)-methyltransferase
VPLAVCATPIGNLEDVTLRVLRELAEADLVLCEDTRRTRVLLDRHGVSAKLLSYHEHNEAKRVAEVVPRLEAGEKVALVTDAGLPGISDPGARLVAAALAAGVPVTVLPGASAVETALVASGLAADRYAFWGWVPRRAAERERFLRESAEAGLPVVAFESPRRVRDTLAALHGVDPGRRVAVCRELTKLHEQVVRGRAEEVLAGLPDPVLGEVALVLAPAPDSAAGERAARALEVAHELVAAGLPASRAAALASALAGVPRRGVYEALLSVRSERQ